MMCRVDQLLRKTLLFLGVASVTAVMASGGPYAPPAGQSGSSAIHKDSSIITSWAIDCALVRGPKDIAKPDSGLAEFGIAGDGTGLPGQGIVSLGDGGTATLRFSGYVYDGAGPDFAIFENSFSDDFLELGFVEVSSDGQNFYRFESVSLTQDTAQVNGFGSLDATDIHNLAGKYRADYGTPFDLEEMAGVPGLDIDSITHIRIIDVIGTIDTSYASRDGAGRIINDPYPTNFESGGFDLDAVGVIHLRDTTPTAIARHELSTFRIYPNPARGYFWIKGSMDDGRLEVVDGLGRSVYETAFHGSFDAEVRIETIGWPKGMYWVRYADSYRKEVRPLIVQ